ncbi:MAG: ribosome maturation factor RimP [Actinomycetota bacterium]|nr:ribosome maturation factor RimP [Actinomycetota bacterium]
MGALEEVTNLAEAVTLRRSLRLWDVEMAGQPGRMVVRVLVDADGGIDLDTVAEVSEEISRGLDLEDPLTGRYTLEVSSPGLERTLKSSEHFKLSHGSRVTIKTRERLALGSHRIDGTIRDAGESAVTIETDAAGEVDVPYDQIKSARTVFEWGARTS